MRHAAIALTFTITFLSLAMSADPKAADPKPVQVSDEALRIHKEALLVDGHNDLPWQMREKADLSFQKLDISRDQKGIHTDLPRLKKGGVGAQFWVAYVPVESRKKGTAVRETL
jgi:membrane dipeptidase